MKNRYMYWCKEIHQIRKEIESQVSRAYFMERLRQRIIEDDTLDEYDVVRLLAKLEELTV